MFATWASGWAGTTHHRGIAWLPKPLAQTTIKYRGATVSSNQGAIGTCFETGSLGRLLNALEAVGPFNNPECQLELVVKNSVCETSSLAPA